MFVNAFALHLVIFVMPFDIQTGMVYLYTTSVSLEDVCYINVVYGGEVYL